MTEPLVSTSPINFFKGHPTDNLLPVDEILRATQSLLTRDRPTDKNDDDRHPLTYGSDPGSREVRKLIGDWSQQACHEGKNYPPIDPYVLAPPSCCESQLPWSAAGKKKILLS